jgi:hypothetical protein
MKEDPKLDKAPSKSGFDKSENIPQSFRVAIEGKRLPLVHTVTPATASCV